MFSVSVAPARSTAISDYSCSSLVQQRRVGPLTFGASDGLWDTLSKSQGKDSVSEKLIG